MIDLSEAREEGAGGPARAPAGPAASGEWEQGLAGMVAYAAGKGWVEADGGALAHIERRGAG